MLSNRSFPGEQLRDLVYKTCRGAKEKKAYLHVCRDLATWDLRFDLDSRGAALWRELMQQLAKNGEIPWRATFDPTDATTPSGLALAETEILAALERATNALEDAKVATNARLGDVQRAAIGTRSPVPGGQALDGVANVVTWAEWNGTLLPRATRDAPLTPGGLGAGGYPVNYGTSWVMAVDLERGGPDADVLLTYGPGDQLERFGRGQLRHALFEDEEIRADPELVVEEVSSGGRE
jgi:acyl-homoserine-lactone acylase